MFFHQLRLEGPGAIPRRLEFKLAAGVFHGLLGFAVAAVTGNVIGQVGVELALQRGLGQLLDQRCQYTVLASDGLPRLNRLQGFFKIEFLAHSSILSP